MIEFQNVIKRYENNLAVDNLNLTIKEGEIFGLLGPNGAGKTTANKMLIGLLRPTSGTITVNGLDVTTHGLETRSFLSLVPQELAIYETMTAKENIKYFGRLFGLHGKRLQELTDQTLDFTGLTEVQNVKAQKYSGGMKRRLNIACAIVNKPKIVIMDEPTVGIDPQSRAHILDSIKTLNKQGMTVIYTSHYMSEVEDICDRVGIIDHGKLISLGSTDEVKAQVNLTEKIVIEAKNISFAVIDEVKKLYDVKNAIYQENQLEILSDSIQNVVLDILSILAKHKIELQKLELKKLTLEDVFLALTGRSLRD